LAKVIETDLNVIKITEIYKEYSDIGKVKYVYNKKARNFTLRINQKGQVRVTIPRFGTISRAEKFLIERKSWVRKKLSDIRQNNAGIISLKEGLILNIRGRQIALSAALNGGDLESAFWKILLVEARRFLPARVEELSLRYNLPYQELKIKKMKSRWGSCSPKNSINLNSWLVMLPEHLIDYVICHELVHTIQKDHSPRFWDRLDKICGGNARNLRAEMRKYPIMFRLEQ